MAVFESKGQNTIVQALDYEETLAQKIDFSMYPNPAFGSEVHFENLPINNHITIYNSVGKLIFGDIIENSKMTVDIAQFPEGQYYVQVSLDVRKLIVR